MVARIAALAALVLAVLLVAVLLLGGDPAHRYYMEFETAGQLVKDDDVQIGGRRIGSIKAIELTRGNLARIEIEVQEPFAPLHEGTTGVIRATSLSGVANRYIALTPGPNDAKELAEDAVLSTDKTTTIVDLDQLFATFDTDTRKDLQRVVQGFATQLEGRTDEASEAAEYFNPAISQTARLFRELSEDEGALSRFIVNSARTVTALAERRDDLSALVADANTTAGAIADEEVALTRALELLPTTLRRGNTTFVNLRSTLDDLDVLVAESKPATKDLEPFLRRLRPLVAAAKPTLRDLRRLVGRTGPDNDLVDATKLFPKLQPVVERSVGAQVTALKKAQPVLEFIRPYTPEFTGWLRDFSQAAAYYDANGHYARIQPVFNAFLFSDNPAGGVLTPIPPEDRLDYVETGQVKRCPGGALAQLEDQSNPFLDNGGLGPEDCDPATAPPGP